MDILEEITSRALVNGEFTFQTLHRNLPHEAYRLADKTLQSWRKKGWAEYKRVGRQFVWSLTEKGKAELSA